MPYEIVMPQLGLTMTEGSVTSWLKQPGDRVEKGEIIFTVETDKVEMEVESFGRGYLDRILILPEQVVPVGTVIATLSDSPPLAASSSQAAAEETHADETPAESASTTTSEELAISPRARRIARELGVDLATVHPASGTRVTEEDVRRVYEASLPSPTATKSELRHTAVRKVTARRMTASFQSAPHFYLGVEANASELLKLRESQKEVAITRVGTKLTYTDLFLKAMAMALAEQPLVNQYWRDGELMQHDSVDIGFAAQTSDGLLVPVVRHAQRLGLFDLAREREALRQKARNGALSFVDMEGGSATLSNLGAFGIDSFQAILNPPQSVILATGRIAKRAVVIADQVQAQPTVALNLSADHRVLDGVTAANFLARIRELIENPHPLLG